MGSLLVSPLPSFMLIIHFVKIDNCIIINDKLDIRFQLLTMFFSFPPVWPSKLLTIRIEPTTYCEITLDVIFA